MFQANDDILLSNLVQPATMWHRKNARGYCFVEEVSECEDRVVYRLVIGDETGVVYSSPVDIFLELFRFAQTVDDYLNGT